MNDLGSLPSTSTRKRKNVDAPIFSPDINRFTLVSSPLVKGDEVLSKPPEKQQLRRTPIKVEDNNDIMTKTKEGLYDKNIQRIMQSYPRQIYSLSPAGPRKIHPKTAVTTTTSKSPPKMLNNNNLLSYFVGSCSTCIFVESHSEIMGQYPDVVVEQGLQVDLSCYGTSEVIYSNFGIKEAAIKAAQKYAKDQGLQFGIRQNDNISFEPLLPDASETPPSSNNGIEKVLLKEIQALKYQIKDNSELVQKEMNEMRDDLNDKFDDLRNAMLQCLQSFQPGSISRGGESALGPMISTQQWTFDFDETEARIMKTRFGNEFESAFYNRFFKETETLLKKLPAKKEMEYRNIVTYFSGAITNSELRKVSVRLNDIIRKKNHALMNKISRGSNPAIAMLENSPTVPLIENEDGILVPESDIIAYTRYEDDAIKRYPILLKNGRECDTMFAERRIDNIRRWDYFVISADGLRTDAFYHYY